MQWLELTIKTTSEAIDLLSASLTQWGFDSFLIDDEQDFEQFLEHNHEYWDYVEETLTKKMQGLSQIRLYLEDGPDAMETVSSLRTQLALLRETYPAVSFGDLTVSLQNTRDEDWENNWKQYYQPVEIGSRLLVVPHWLHPENPDHRIPILLDPGMIFGTGNHASTQMCLKALEQAVHGGEAVLDLGSGSGILSIAALLLGAATATLVDIDEKAESIARENGARNHLYMERLIALTGNVLGDDNLRDRLFLDGGYDLILANIVADVLIPLAPVVPRFLRPGGTYICSGILDIRLPEVEDAMKRAGLTILEVNQKDDWRQITATV